ncbi:MAG: hypothetical protein QXD41_02110 [Nitrososphaeria archaeon]
MFWTGETLSEQFKTLERVDTSFQFLQEQLVRFQSEQISIKNQIRLTQELILFIYQAKENLPNVIPLNDNYPYEFFLDKKFYLSNQNINFGIYRYFFPRTKRGSILYTIAPMLTPDGIPLHHFPESNEFLDINFKMHLLKSPESIQSEYQYTYNPQISTIRIKGSSKTDLYNGLIITTINDKSGWGLDSYDIQKILQLTTDPKLEDQKEEIKTKVNFYTKEVLKIANWRANDMLRRLQNIVRSLNNVSLSKPLPEVIGYFDDETGAMFYYAPGDEKVVDSRQKSAGDIKNPQDVDSIVNWIATADSADPITVIHTALPFAAALKEHYRKFYRPTIRFHNPFRK